MRERERERGQERVRPIKLSFEGIGRFSEEARRYRLSRIAPLSEIDQRIISSSAMLRIIDAAIGGRLKTEKSINETEKDR